MGCRAIQPRSAGQVDVKGQAMQRYSFTVALRIWHPSIDPALISGNLGLKPQRLCQAGEARRTPKGTLLTGAYPESYWHCYPFDVREYSSTDQIAADVLTDVLEILEPHKPFLLLLREQGARIHLQVSSFSARNYALELSPHMLLRSAELGISIVHDVFPSAQNW